MRSLPVLMFLIFAAFWSAYDVVLGLWLAILPSALVGLAIVLKLGLGASPPAAGAAPGPPAGGGQP